MTIAAAAQVFQKSAGNGSPNIYAPGASAVVDGKVIEPGRVLRPDGVIPARFVHHKVDLAGCLTVTFTNPKDFHVESSGYEKKVEISITRPGVADCVMDGK